MDDNAPQKTGTTPGALVVAGERIDHAETSVERKKRELAAAFNRMGSDSDAEAHNAFERARGLVVDLLLSFDGIYRASAETDTLREANAGLGRQLRLALQENAKYRSMNLSYKIKGRLAQILRGGFFTLCLGAPVIVIGLLFYSGAVSAMGAALLLAPVGLYDTARGMVQSHYVRLVLGSVLLLASVVGFLTASHQDTPYVHRRQAQVIENMNRDQDLGPKTFYIDYPLSHTTLIMTVVGTHDAVKITVDGAAAPLEIYCNKYYEASVTVPQSNAAYEAPPEKPDIFHRQEAATFGPCDLYAQLTSLH